MFVAVVLPLHALPLSLGDSAGERSLPLLMLTLRNYHCPQSLVGRYPRSSGSSVTLWATSGSPWTHRMGKAGTTCRCEVPGNSRRLHDK